MRRRIAKRKAIAVVDIIYAVDCIKDTASSHARAFVIEVMGRNSGYLASVAAIASGAEFNTTELLARKRDFLDEFLNVRAFMQRVEARPAFQRAMKSTMPNGPPAM